MKESSNICDEDLTDSGDGGIIRSILREGEDQLSPTDDSVVTVYIKGTYQDVVFDDREIAFTLGLGFEHKIVDGVEKAITKFNQGERSLLTISHSYAFGEGGCEEFGVPSCACVQYEVQLISFVKPKQLWELTPAEKIDLAERFKSKGTYLYKCSSVTEALAAYSKAKWALEEDPNYSVQEVQQRAVLLLHINLNCALCQLKMSQWNEALESCNTVLEVEFHNEKAVYRKAQAYMGRGDYTEAINEFQAVLNINPSNKAASNSISVAQQRLKDANAKVKQTYAGMFQKFADRDSQAEALAKARGSINNEPIGYWSNDMAAGMMSLQQEMEAFGERMPERSRRSSDGSGGGSPRQ